MTFLVTAHDVADFIAGYDAAHWTPIWAEANGNWKRMVFLEGVEPPSCVIGDIARDSASAGIMYRSARQPDGVCLVLFPEAKLSSAVVARVHDPNLALTGDGSSWPQR